MTKFDRRSFLKSSALVAIPTFGAGSALASVYLSVKEKPEPERKVVLIGDGPRYSPSETLEELQKINAITPILNDSYGKGGTVQALEEKFAELTGKEKAIFIPTGTLANQLAIAALSGKKAKVIVQDLSHINRDEADANLEFNTKLVPLALEKTYFTAEELQRKIQNLPSEEYFYSGIGAISIENPVRRANGEFIPIEELVKIKQVCDAESIKMHLDGARLYFASAWSGVPIKDYCSLFDTVYISLYKYLGANGGAILCGEKSLIEDMPRQIKVHGGNIYQNWVNSALALYHIESIEQKLKEVKKRSDELLNELDHIEGVSVEFKKNSTNVYLVQLPTAINTKKMSQQLDKEFNIVIIPASETNRLMIMMNETILNQSSNLILNAFKTCLSNPENFG